MTPMPPIPAWLTYKARLVGAQAHWWFRLAAMKRLLRRQNGRLRSLEWKIVQMEEDVRGAEREKRQLQGEIDALKMQVDGAVAAHELLVERTEAELSLSRLRRIGYDSGSRPTSSAGDDDQE